ncbi:RecQ family zinc-binding domain-containing protein [Paraconexibacter antarcticus]|uniref:RecQ family zinc-binding domain-containing protein n=1 Tax=Paraconexibacter antarcticus TaxID=2949664 RepID=A0ABY5DZ25_9ACTN|nr:RecQ family zinc-binding domain-containing protein [Paraconexibacter antarcticus]UTI66097.1 RecQ family zinc-binding domain-containing protein [Paraconexibacter antarcticus]
MRPAPDGPPLEEAVAAGRSGEAQRKAMDRTRVDMMRAYAETSGCRRAFVLGYFGEPFEPPCGACDNCAERPASAADGPAADTPFATGDRVRHQAWGEGTVGRLDGATVTVAFDTVGYRTLALEVVAADPGLLVPA